jgi:hypothetical protein
VDETFKKWSIPYSSLGHLPNLKIKSLGQDVTEQVIQKPKISHPIRRKNAATGRRLLESKQE